MNKNQIKFKKNESFYIRDGWFEKSINSISENQDINIFSRNNGTSFLGIGSNMVKGLRYWLHASKLIKSSSAATELTEFGKLVQKWDPYFENDFTWYLVHYYLASNYFECPIFYFFFNSNFKSVRRKDFLDYIKSTLISEGYIVKNDYLEDDLNVFLKTYYNDSVVVNPEDNYICPLSKLKLIKKKGDKYEKKHPKFSSLSFLIIYFSLTQKYGYDSFNIEDSLSDELSPVSIFNLDKNMYLQYLEEMKKYDLITINKTAGLNVVYFNKKLELADIFESYFERRI